jgi:Patatin-like phospholipase
METAQTGRYWRAGNEAKAARRNSRLGKSLGWALLVSAVILLCVGVTLYVTHVFHATSLLRLQWAGSSKDAFDAVYRHDDAVRTALWWDTRALIAGTLGLLLACYLGRLVFWPQRLRSVAVVGMAVAFGAGVLGLAQNWLLLIALDHRIRGNWIVRIAEALSFARYSALPVAAVIGVTALVTTFGRLCLAKSTQVSWAEKFRKFNDGDRPAVIPPPLIEAVGSEGRRPAATRRGRLWSMIWPPPLEEADLCRCWWETRLEGPETHWAQGFASPVEYKPDSLGVCVSGGGVRSAAVALGALQALREDKVLYCVDYLVSVSGGGYTTGAMQLALTPKKPERRKPEKESSHSRSFRFWLRLSGASAPANPGTTGATPTDVFAPGSAEEDHVRRHSSYIADNLGEWIVAMGVLFRGVVSALIVNGLIITVLGLAIAKFYSFAKIMDNGNLAGLQPLFLFSRHPNARPLHPPRFPTIAPGVTLAIVVAAALTVMFYFLQLWSTSWSPARRRISHAARTLLAVTAVLTSVGLALPTVIWASSRLTWALGSPAKAISVGSLSVVAAYGGTVAATLWRKRATLVKTGETASGWFRGGAVHAILPNSMIQMIIMWICLAVVSLAALLLCGWVATSGADKSLWAIAPVAALMLIVAVVDQTSFSLHPFYRLRLARAFAVRRAPGAAGVAEPYDDLEMTWLRDYGCRPEGFPEVTFMATANITGEGLTPPGRPAIPFALRHDYIGSPQVGWVRTDFLQELTWPCIVKDLTVEAAMAISGASFASAMGSRTRFYELFLALSNARLGAWLPNPYFVALKLQHLDDWTVPGLPGKRRLSYLAREIFGVHPGDGRLLLCTDGGHYDNLGLVELLRRRCKRIYCIDASGALPPLNDDLASAITLAREELGVEITFKDDAHDLIAGSAEPIKPEAIFADLNKRLSKNAVTVATITYPQVGDGPQEEGDLVLAQAVLTPQMPYQLLEYSQIDTGFPRDSTADQSFNARQFDGYQQLGQFIGHAAARRGA